MHRTRLRTVYLPVYGGASAFNATSFDEDPFTSQCEKEDTILNGFKFRNFIGCSQVTVVLFVCFLASVGGNDSKGLIIWAAVAPCHISPDIS